MTDPFQAESLSECQKGCLAGLCHRWSSAVACTEDWDEDAHNAKKSAWLAFRALSGGIAVWLNAHWHGVVGICRDSALWPSSFWLQMHLHTCVTVLGRLHELCPVKAMEQRMHKTLLLFKVCCQLLKVDLHNR